MNWKTALTACGFTPSAGDEMRKDSNRRGWAWSVCVPQTENGAYAASLAYEQTAGVRVCHATAEGETADAAFMTLLNEKVGPGGVRVAAFIGAPAKRHPVFCEVEECPGSDMPTRLTAQCDMPGGTAVNRRGDRAKDSTELYAVTPNDVVKGEEFEPSFYGPVFIK